MPEYTEFPIPRKAITDSGVAAAIRRATDTETTSQLDARDTANRTRDNHTGQDTTDQSITAQPGDDLASAYTAAKALTPGGSALSASNRATLIIMPGQYELSSELAIDAEFVDVVAAGEGSCVRVTGNALNVSADDVVIRGIDVGSQELKITGDKPLQVWEFCTGGDGSFGGDGTASGTFTNCTGGSASFGGYGTASGTASGTFTNCTGGNLAFGGYGGTASGTFTNCTGGDGSFGGDGTASGTFTNCTGGDGSFGGDFGTASGTFTNCTGGDGSFGGDFGTASGTFTNCTGGVYSFGYGGTLSGKLYRCKLTSNTFETVSGGGITRLCIDGNDAENNQG